MEQQQRSAVARMQSASLTDVLARMKAWMQKNF
jgi:hypothetical protein